MVDPQCRWMATAGRYEAFGRPTLHIGDLTALEQELTG